MLQNFCKFNISIKIGLKSKKNEYLRGINDILIFRIVKDHIYYL